MTWALPMKISSADAARKGGRDVLAAALLDSRERSLSLLDAYVAALGEGLPVAYSVAINPPLWEAGHVGWFQDWWIARNRHRALGIRADPGHARAPSRLAEADDLYNSSVVAHTRRWHLPLPDLGATRAYLAAGLEDTLGLLAEADDDDAALYFYRLVLFHEDMHTEAAIYMAQALDIPVPDALIVAERRLLASLTLAIDGRRWRQGHAGDGFAFDNELMSHDIEVPAFAIDSEVVSWRRYLECVEDTEAAPPRYLRRDQGVWQARRFGVWRELDLDTAATHLTWHEADAWCRWAGRRLPTEVEWELAALTHPAFQWGAVWEWTASRFLPYPGFVRHPYRDYSAPWFGDRYVLRGASRATTPRMAHPRYRNYFPPERNDLHNGFRSCAI